MIEPSYPADGIEEPRELPPERLAALNVQRFLRESREDFIKRARTLIADEASEGRDSPFEHWIKRHSIFSGPHSKRLTEAELLEEIWASVQDTIEDGLVTAVAKELGSI